MAGAVPVRELAGPTAARKTLDEEEVGMPVVMTRDVVERDGVGSLYPGHGPGRQRRPDARAGTNGVLVSASDHVVAGDVERIRPVAPHRDRTRPGPPTDPRSAPASSAGVQVGAPSVAAAH